MIHKGSRYPRRIHKGSREVHWLLKGSRTIYMSPAAARAATEAWLAANVALLPVMVTDDDGFWFELEVILPPSFDGNPTDGWVGTIADGYPPATLGLFRSETLTSWSDAGEGWGFSPGREDPETMGTGWKKWFVRCLSTPVWWASATIDQRLTTERHGKSITDVSVLGSSVSLPNYPYAMPADASQLQTDLVAEGFTGATVTSATGTWNAEIRNYDKDPGNGGSPARLVPTWSGSSITALVNTTAGGTSVTLPNFPYVMPTDEALLESDLVDEGYTYAQVTLYKDTWEIFVPDLETTGNERRFELTISPADPIQLWTFFGTDNGLNDQTELHGTPENIRISGGEVPEAFRAFARLGFINIPTV